MQIKILAFGVAKDILGGREMEFSIPEGATVERLKQSLHIQFPELKKLASMAIAVNGGYADDGEMIQSGDEVVLIPPVSGG